MTSKAATMAALAIAGSALLPLQPVHADNTGVQQTRAAVSKTHRMVVQVTQNDPAVMNMALNNVENLRKHYAAKGEAVEVEFVAYGPGLHMLRSDTSPVRERLAAMSGTTRGITFSGCGNSMTAQSKNEGKDITLLPEARVVQTGIARIMELQEDGWTYVRP